METHDDIIVSEEDARQYRGLVLENGLKVLLVSDPTTDKSAAALDVHIGHLSDPPDLPGLAHFCEHMLFLGSEQFPEEQEYRKYLSQHGGGSNASTGSEHTNFYFDLAPGSLCGALDRFSQFFLSPLFTESATDREVNAVNSEHEKNVPNDARRMRGVEKATVDPNHVYSKFGTGSRTTLEVNPKERGVSVRDALLAFHNKWYSSNIMGLTVLGQEDLDTLQQIVTDRFAQVENKRLEIPEWTQPPFDETQCGTITHIVPVKDIRKLVITWGIPDLAKQFRAGPGGYLSHLVGHEGPGSLLSQLRTSGWAIGLTAGTRVGGRGFSFFYLSIDLTEEGIDHVDDSILVVFQYLLMLKTAGPQKRIFEEIRDLRKMRFHFKDKESPREYVRMLAKDLHAYPLPQVLSGGWLLSDWQPDLITDLLDQLTPSLARLTVVGRCFADQCDQEEKYYGAKYSLRCIPKEQMEAWATAPLHDNLHLPEPNEFIPTDFNLAPRDVHAMSNLPSVLHEDEFSRLWFKQDNEFLLPKTCVTVLLRSPFAYFDPHHANLTHMLAVMFEDQTNEKLYTASLSGLYHSMCSTKSGLLITLRGYHHKQPVLLEKIIDLLLTFEVDEARFPALKDAYQRKLKNFSAEQPQQHTAYHTSLLLTENIWEKAELLEALDQMSVSALNLFLPQLLSRYLEFT